VIRTSKGVKRGRLKVHAVGIAGWVKRNPTFSARQPVLLWDEARQRAWGEAKEIQGENRVELKKGVGAAYVADAWRSLTQSEAMDMSALTTGPLKERRGDGGPSSLLALAGRYKGRNSPIGCNLLVSR